MNKEKIEEVEFDFNLNGLFEGFQKEIEDKGPVIPELTEEELKSLNETEEVEEEVEEEIDESEEETTEEVETKKEELVEKEIEVEYSYKALAEYLAEQGVIDFEDSEDIEDTPELLEKAVLETAQNMVNEYKESIPEEGKRFLDYLEKGGDPNKYLKTFEKDIDLENIDLEDVSNQKKIVAELLKLQNYSNEEISETLQDYEDGLILEKQAKIASKKLEKFYANQKEQLIAQQNAELESRKEAANKYINEIKLTINSSDTLGGLSVSSSDKKQFEKYLLEKDRSGLSQYEKDLQENPVLTQLELAFLKYKKFDFSKLAKEVKTKESKRLRGVFKAKETTVKGKSREIEKETAGDISSFSNLF